MHPENKNILAINGGSSSLKFSLYERVPGQLPEKWISGKIDRIGLPGSKLTYTNKRKENNSGDPTRTEEPVDAKTAEEAAASLLGWLDKQDAGELAAIGHRVVHGLEHHNATKIDDKLLKELHSFESYDPDHLPVELKLIELFRKKGPNITQIACFDTAFHASLPQAAKLLPLPRKYFQKGIKRYGFHGLSYAYLMEELTRLNITAARGSVILAHLGSGASLAAVKEGISIDTTMGFTPVGGIPMGTRTGDLDPGVAWYLLQKEKFTPAQFNQLINHESGLLGLSEISGDMQDLLEKESSDSRAAEAINVFCYQTRKCIGAFAAALGGVDALVFSGGIGEKSPAIRSRICENLSHLGISLDAKANEKNAVSISATQSRTPVYAIPTDEEWMIARTVDHLLNTQ